MKKKRRNILLLIGALMVLHIVISIISVIKVGEATNFLAERSNVPNEVIQNPEMAKNWIEKETRDRAGFWYPVFHFINHYPVGWIMTPTTAKLGKNIANRYLKKPNQSFTQMMVKVWAIALSKMLINSFFFSMCIVGCWLLLSRTLKRT